MHNELISGHFVSYNQCPRYCIVNWSMWILWLFILYI